MTIESVGYNRKTLLEMLKNRIVEVRFRKADDTIRVLRGTLLDEYLPEKYRKEGITPDDLVEPSKQQDNLVTLWDVDDNDWRSVRTDRIIDVL
jgi:WYL_2, Sm-like SH3 beta-barrel fold